jgi:hypothetical protein
VQRLLVGTPEVNNHWADPDVDVRIILRWMQVRDVYRVLVGKAEGKRTLG